MMTQREKLIDIVENFDVMSAPTENFRKHLSDYLLDNGVVVLPCRCGECEHCDIGQNDVEQWCICQLKRIDVDPTDFCSYGKRKGGDE